MAIEMEAVLRIVADACHVARAVQQDLKRVQSVTKDDRSPVTVADFAVQAVVALGLRAHPHGDRIVGEERADLLRDPAHRALCDEVVRAVRLACPDATPDGVLDAIDGCNHDGRADAYWTLDPIDGTKGFLRGQQYAIALGWLESGTVTAGFMGCPNLPGDHSAPLDVADAVGVMYAARRGEGAWSTSIADPAGRTEVVATTGEVAKTIRVCESVEAAHSSQSDSARIIEHLGSTSAPVRLDSQCKYAVVARSQADAYLRMPTRKAYVEKIWDHAAGSLIATEAGAVVSDISGAPLDFTQGRRLERNRGVICAREDLHPRIIEAIASEGVAAAT